MQKRIARLQTSVMAFLLAIAFLVQALPATLSYSEGGPAAADPASSLSPDLRRYVDAAAGDDARDGKSPSNAWKTLAKVNAQRSILAPGAHVLFKRGGTWTGNLDFTGVTGAEGNRLVLGAYGLPLLARPKVLGQISVDNSGYVMVRDFDCIKISASAGARYVVIFDNVVHGSPEMNDYPSNGIRVFAESHHIAIVGNLIYDLGANDCIAIHPSAVTNVRDCHWIVDNVTIGNGGMEDGIDLAMSEITKEPYIASDVKVVCNRLQANALSGLSVKIGRGAKCLSAGHEGRYIWIVGNIMGGSNHIGLNPGDAKENFRITGNVLFNCANNMANPVASAELSPLKLSTIHNTFIHTQIARAPVKIEGTEHRFLYNLLVRTQSGGNFAEVTPEPPASNISAMDSNWYGPSAAPMVDGKSFDAWRSYSGFDGRSGAGPVPGVSSPDDTAWPDPRRWKDSAFLEHFIPARDFGGCRGEATPGAFDCSGNRLGLVIKPMAGLDNNGLGWEGPPLVREKLLELGVRYGDSAGTSLQRAAGAGSTGLRMMVTPNPLAPASEIRFSRRLQSADISIVDLRGKKVFRVSSFNGLSLQMDAGSLAAGVYLVLVKENANVIGHRITLFR